MTETRTPGVAVVTGASAGIGAVYADRLAKRGYDLILVARRRDRLEALAQRLRANYKVSVDVVAADLADPRDLASVAESIAVNPRITLLVNNAGTSKLAKLAETTPAEQEAIVAVNVTALTRLSVVALERFVERNRGTIINIGSVLGFHTLPISSIYSGTKAYVMSFTRGLQDEVAGTDVSVQLVMPAVTATDIWSLAGLPLSALDQNSIMTAEDMVDASLSGLDHHELFTLPSVPDLQLWTDYETARTKLFAACQTGIPAPRYSLAA